MTCAVVSIVIALAFAPQKFAVLRPLFPVKPEPPFSGEAIVIQRIWSDKRNSAVNIRIPTTNPAMEDDIARSLLELVEIVIPMLKARSCSFVGKYLRRPLAPSAHVLSLEENPAEWRKPATPS
jgi:hypothetical protein